MYNLLVVRDVASAYVQISARPPTGVEIAWKLWTTMYNFGRVFRL